jgi:predicted neuraminidase
MQPCWFFPDLVLVLVYGLVGMMASGAGGGQEAVLRAELVYSQDDRPTASCHASTIAQTSNGDIVAAWFAGTRERAEDVGIWVSRLGDDRWSRPVEVADGVMSPQKRFPCWNPVLFQPQEGPLLLFFKVGPSPSEWWGEWMVSLDNGKTWHDRKRLPAHVMGPIKNKPVQLTDGRILCPSSSEHQGWRVHIEVTADLKNWEVIGPLNDGVEMEAIQPTILQYADGRLHFLCRTRNLGRIAQSWSKDGGRSWSPLTATSLPNPNSGIDAVTLKDGRQLLVFNNTPQGRTPLNVAVSSDGEKWDVVLTLEDQPGEYSYPAVIQTADGLVHVTYTYQRRSIKHVVLDPVGL